MIVRGGFLQAGEVSFFKSSDGDTSCACMDTRETPMLSGAFAANVYPNCTSTHCGPNLYNDIITYSASEATITAVNADARFEFYYAANLAPGYVKVVSNF